MSHVIYRRQSRLVKIFRFFPWLVFEICFGVGLVVLKLVKIFWPGGKLHRKLQRKLDLWRQVQPGLTLTTFVVLALLVVGLFQTANLAATAEHLVGRVLGTADTGLAHLSAAKDLLQQQDLNGASSRLAEAIKSFEQSRQELNSNNGALQSLLDLVPQKQDGDALLQATILLSEAGTEWTQFYQLSQGLKITPQGIVGDNASPTVLKQMNEHLQAGRTKTDQALALISQIDPGIIPEDKRPTFIEVKNNLGLIRTAIDTVSDVVDILYAMVSGEKHILFLFENNSELRATGGFMGTFGQMDVKDGQINQLHISSIYDLDGQLQENIAPPLPIRAVNPQWYLRDTNWFSDFSESAQVITRFYQKESKGAAPDLIVALTPQLVTDILKVTGPVNLPRYNVTFTAENFVELAQFESSVNYDKTLNQPKQILADFFPTMLQQLGSLSGDQLVPVVEALQRNLQQKHILLYARDPDLQQRLQSYNWAGTIKATDRDYLLVSSSNLGGTKTDNTLRQSLHLDSNIDAAGQITNTLTITRTNPLTGQEGSRNISYIRIYVPEGSQLVSAQGFTPIGVENLPVSPQQTDPAVANWDKASIIDRMSGTLIGKESGKTIFGNWLEVRGGQTKTVTLTYKLPFKIADLDHYSLLVQKQPGTAVQDLVYSLKLDQRHLVWTNFQLTSSDNSSWSTVLDKDLFLGLILQRDD